MRRQLSILAQRDVFDFFFSLSPVFSLVAAGQALAYYREGWDKALEIVGEQGAALRGTYGCMFGSLPPQMPCEFFLPKSYVEKERNSEAC